MSQKIEIAASSNAADESLRALDAKYYSSEDIFAEEKEKLFFKAWQYA